MRFFLYGTYIPSAQLIEVARIAEELGFAGITVPDHVVYPFATATTYPYAPDPASDRAPWDETCEWPDPFVSAAAILASTETFAVLTGIFVLPLREPLLVAKGASTLGALFPGRFILGVGAGWLREEFELLGSDFDRRGPRCDEAIAVLRACFCGGHITHDGRFYTVPEIAMEPVAEPAVPIYVGGDSRPALRRAARLADGILPPLNSQRRTAEHIARIAALRAEAGREGPFDYVAAAVTLTAPEQLAALSELGVESVHVDPFQLYVRRYGGLTMQERRDALTRYAAEVIEPYQATCALPS
jgi:probable F420-dependent oxidoreductase